NSKDKDRSPEKTGEREKQWEERWGSLPPDYTYGVISRLIDLNAEFVTKPVYSELIDSANMLSSPESSRSSVLYQNAVLKKKAEQGADERRLAAWYYLNSRYTLEAIVANSELTKKYVDLGNQLSDTLIEADNDLADKIRRQVKEFK